MNRALFGGSCVCECQNLVARSAGLYLCMLHLLKAEVIYPLCKGFVATHIICMCNTFPIGA